MNLGLGFKFICMFVCLEYDIIQYYTNIINIHGTILMTNNEILLGTFFSYFSRNKKTN